MRDLVVLLCVSQSLCSQLPEPIGRLVVRTTLDVELMLSGIFVDFCEHEILITVFVGVIQELNPLEHLETVYSSLLELVDAYGVLRWLVIEADMPSLCMHLSLVLGAINRFARISILYLFGVYDHF